MANPEHASTVQLDAIDESELSSTWGVVVLSKGRAEHHTLPEMGALRVGRGVDCDVRLVDVAVSRVHACIHAGAVPAVEDLGSGNGTRLNGRRLRPDERAPIQHRDLIELGDTMIVVQQPRGSQPRRRLYAHEAFEAHLEDACARQAPRFSVARVRVEGEASGAAIEAALTAGLGPRDTVAAYAPGEFELLLFGATPEQMLGDISPALSAAEVTWGLARCPEDGRTPDTLLDAANAALMGRAEAAEDGPILVDPGMQQLFRLATRVAQGGISVLILGETGVGKEVLAEHIHSASPRAGKPYVKLNCAAISESLLESELFGYEKGAFTGAERDKPGLLESADGGTVFLDELGEMAPGTQSKLLRVLEQREVLRVGGLTPRAIDVRFVCATNRELRDEIEAGRFREDLYYRLEGVTLQIPPLRERITEIAPLVARFTARLAADLGLTPHPRFTEESVRLLEQYAWPGNIRELRNVVERALLLATEVDIEPRHLPLDKLQVKWQTAPARTPPPPTATGDDRDLDAERDARERARIEEALQAEGGNQTRAAARLNISRRTLSKKLDKYGFSRPRKK